MIGKTGLRLIITILFFGFINDHIQAQNPVTLSGEQFINKYKTAMANRDSKALRDLFQNYSFQGRIVANHLHYKGVESFRNGEIEQAINELVDAQDLLGRLGDHMPRLEALHLLGQICLETGRYKPALRYYEIGFDLARRLKHVREFIHFGVQAATLYRLKGNYAQAMPFLEESLKMAEQVGYQAEHAALLNNMGLLHMEMGDFKKARRFFENALVLSVELSDKANGGRILKNLGRTYFQLGEYEEALSYNARALSLLQDTGDREGEADVRFNFGETYEIAGDNLNALTSFHEALGIYYEIADSTKAISTLGRIAHLNWPNTTFEESLTSFENNLKTARESNDRETEAMLLKNMGEVLFYSGRYAEAIATLERARKMLDLNPNPEYERYIYSTQGLIYYEIGRYNDALQALRQALILSKSTHNDAEELAAMTLTGKIYFQTGHLAEAAKLLSKSLEIGKSKALYSDAMEAIVYLRKIYVLQAMENKLDELQIEIDNLRKVMQPTDITPAITTSIGDLYLDMEDYGNATLYYDESLTYYLRHDRKALTGGAFLKIANTLAANNDTTKAISHYEHAMDAVKFVDDLDGIAAVQMDFGHYRMKTNQLVFADTLLSRALAFMRRSGNRIGVIECLISLSDVDSRWGNPAKAVSGLNSALKLARGINSVHHQTRILNKIADISLANRSEKGAVKAYQQLFKISRDFKLWNEQAIAATKIGDVLIRRSNLQDAIQYYNKALDIYSKMNAYEGYARTTAAMGMIFNEAGRYELADKSLHDAIEQFHDLGMPSHEADIMLEYA
ncbi:MAG: hypothetical protein DWQ10_13690, partial [Calditrichaeota bacterium]